VYVFLNKTEVTREIKLTVRKSTYISIMKYGCESRPWYSKYNSQLLDKIIRHLRRIEGKTKKERI
jgi:hypothetical protein